MAASGVAYAVNVRGRADFYQGNVPVAPMTRAVVDLCIVGGGCLRYVTGNDGMYYFNAVPGNHIVYINGIQRFSLSIPNQYGFDIPPLRGN
jgi:hypothetical protein